MAPLFEQLSQLDSAQANDAIELLVSIARLIRSTDEALILPDILVEYWPLLRRVLSWSADLTRPIARLMSEFMSSWKFKDAGCRNIRWTHEFFIMNDSSGHYSLLIMKDSLVSYVGPRLRDGALMSYICLQVNHDNENTRRQLAIAQRPQQKTDFSTIWPVLKGLLVHQDEELHFAVTRFLSAGIRRTPSQMYLLREDLFSIITSQLRDNSYGSWSFAGVEYVWLLYFERASDAVEDVNLFVRQMHIIFLEKVPAVENINKLSEGKLFKVVAVS